jgi:hypothetical protein
MTLVAEIMLGGAPFLIGDALISSDALSNAGVTSVRCELPLVGEINSLLAAKERTFRVDLCQKLHVFEGRLAVAWSANDATQAKRALDVLREVAKKHDVTMADVKYELDAIDPDRIDKLSLIINLFQGVDADQIHCSRTYRNVRVDDIAGFGRVCSAGSGASTFAEMLKRDGPLPSEVNEGFAALPILGALLNYELSTGRTIDEKWGGAFETSSFSARTGRLEKLDNVLHIFWMWRGDGLVEFQPRFYFARYFDDLLVLRSAEYEASNNPSSEGPIKRLRSNSIRLVPSLLRPLKSEDVDKIGHVDFSYDHVCCHVWFRNPQNAAIPRGALIVGGPRGGGYDIDLSVTSGGSLRLEVPNECVRNVFLAAERAAASFEP